MTIQEKIREGVVVRLMAADEQMTIDKATEFWAKWKSELKENPEHFGDCTNEPVSCMRCLVEDYYRRVDEIIEFEDSQGVVVRVDRELPNCLYDSLIFPTTIEEAGTVLTTKGLTDREKSAVSGTIARLGWESCAKAIDEAGYVAVEPLIEEEK